MPSDLFPDGVEPDSDDVIVALMGMTGAGKSSLISLCSEKKPAIGHNLESCTQFVDTYPFIYDGPPQKRVFLVDTPGFDDSTRSDAEMLRELAAWLTATYAKKIRLSGIIYLHRINQPRMQGSARKNIMMFKKLCGDDALKNVILATTMWDLVDEDVGAAREKQLIETKEFWGYMASKGSKTYRHDNTHQSAMELIGHFVEADSKMTLEIQEEMVDQHKSLNGTAAAAAVEAKIEQERARFAVELRNLETDLREALRKKDNDTMEALREERARYTADLAQIKAAQESLRTTMEKLHEERYAQLEKAMKEQQKVHQTELSAMSTSQASRNPTIKIAVSGLIDKLATTDWNTIKIWDPVTGRCLSTLTSQRGRINAMAWSYDKTRLATGSTDKTIKIWDLVTNRCVSTLKGHSSTIHSVAWSPDGMRLASRFYDKTLKSFEKATSYLSTTLEGHVNPVYLVMWSPDDTRLALTGRAGKRGDLKTEIWDPVKRRRVSTLKMQQSLKGLMAWSPSGMKLAVGYKNGMIDIWDVETGRRELELKTHHRDVQSMAWSQDETQLASGSSDKTAKIWNIATGRCLLVLKGHDKRVYCVAWSLSLSYL